MAWALDLISFLLPPDMKINTIFLQKNEHQHIKFWFWLLPFLLQLLVVHGSTSLPKALTKLDTFQLLL